VDAPDEAKFARFSVVRGGPFWALLRAVGLARDDGGDTRRQVLAFVGVTWVPIVACALAERLATRPWDPLVLDPAVHARLLITVPLLVVAEHVMHALSVRCVDRFVQSGLASEGPGAARPVVARGARLRDARLPEVALAIAAVGVGLAGLWGVAWPFFPAPAGTPSLARVWWAVVALPVAQFLLYRSLWRWAIWSSVLWGLAGLDVRPVALHPDRRGGLAFLAEPVLGFAIVAMSVDCAVAGAWGGRIMHYRVPPQSYAVPFAEIALGGLVVALGPLCVFSRSMWRARFAADRQYDLLALRYARAFHHRWVDPGSSEDILGSPDIQSMADLANTLAIVRGMHIVPFGLREIAALLIALAVPMIPLLLAAVPLPELFRRIANVFLAVVG
jgi:hypothetical protein